MKINDVMIEKSQIDELSAGEVGQAVGKGAKAIGTGIADFAKGVKQGWQGRSAGTAPKGASDPLANIKDSISKLSPKQRAALRTQVAKKAGVQ